MTVATYDWDVRASDITSAFLQSGGIDREVYVRSPKEAHVGKGKVWCLKKTVYGLLDASRGFYLNYAKSLCDLGMEVSRLDQALFLYFEDDSTKESYKRKLGGIISTHVDDSLNVGADKFQKTMNYQCGRNFTMVAMKNCLFVGSNNLRYSLNHD